VRFGKFAGECIAQMQSANDESKLVARALVQSVASAHDVSVLPAQDLESWTVTGSDFGLDVIVKDISEPASEETITRTAKAVMVPLMAAMAELIGYDEETQEESPTYYVQEVEGRPSEVTIIRRERSRRNRLLCLAIHGHRCSVCNCVPSETYGDAGSIIEVHHLEPLALIEMPRAYDPRTDLVPLCPNCHRAIHVRKPVPYSIDELKEMVRRANE
jgi:5-methylcytosine-specific restriction protein A